MRLELTGRHVQITPLLRRLVDRKLAKLDRLLNNSALSAQAVLTVEKHIRHTDITLHTRGDRFLHGLGSAGSWEMSVAEAVDKISQQAKRLKGKWQGRKRLGSVRTTPLREAVEAVAARAERRPRERVRMPRILRTARQTVKAMSVADAARQIDADRGGVVVFRDAETAAISVLYRRPDGELTLVETEA
jgi:putative sigma-54 modulation protein